MLFSRRFRTSARAHTAHLRMLAQRYDYKDHITLYDVASWREILHVTCDTSDAVDLKWSPDGSYVVVWDSCLSYRQELCSQVRKPKRCLIGTSACLCKAPSSAK